VCVCFEAQTPRLMGCVCVSRGGGRDGADALLRRGVCVHARRHLQQWAADPEEHRKAPATVTMHTHTHTHTYAHDTRTRHAHMHMHTNAINVHVSHTLSDQQCMAGEQDEESEEFCSSIVKSAWRTPAVLFRDERVLLLLLFIVALVFLSVRCSEA